MVSTSEHLLWNQGEGEVQLNRLASSHRASRPQENVRQAAVRRVRCTPQIPPLSPDRLRSGSESQTHHLLLLLLPIDIYKLRVGYGLLDAARQLFEDPFEDFLASLRRSLALRTRTDARAVVVRREGALSARSPARSRLAGRRERSWGRPVKESMVRLMVKRRVREAAGVMCGPGGYRRRCKVVVALPKGEGDG